MNNNESQSNKLNKELDTAKEVPNQEETDTAEHELNQDKLSEQNAAPEAELSKETAAETADPIDEVVEAGVEAEEAASETETAANPAAIATAASSAPAPAAAKRSSSTGWIILSAILAIALIIVLVKPPGGGGDNETVATVNGTPIKKDQLYNMLVDVSGAAALDSLILEELVQQQANAASITFTDADVTAEINALKLYYGTDEMFDNILLQNGISLEDLHKDMRLSAMIRKVLEPKTNVTDEAVQQYFDDNKAMWSTESEQVQASHILVDTEDEAKAIAAELEEGADFAELAKAKSKDGSSQFGGDLGFFPYEQMVPEFSEAAFALEDGEISDIVQSQFGYHIIKKTGSKPPVIPTFEEKKEAIHTFLVGEEARALATEWIQDIRENATITNTLDKDDSATAAE